MKRSFNPPWRCQSERCTRALQNIDQVFRLLEKYGLSKYIAIDLGMVQSLNYYTGMIFRGMIRDMGYPVCAGGRYDTLVSEFGVDLPATGFALETRQLLVALERQKGLKPTQPTEVLFVYNPMEEEEGYARIQKLRSEGIRVEVFLPDDSNKSDEDYAREKGIRRIIRLRDGQMKEVTF